VAYVRKDQTKLTSAEWARFIDAINQLHGVQARAPAYREFVNVHNDAMNTAEGMTWSVHSMPSMGMVGRNFMAWHRQFLESFERRLQQVHPEVAVPYWDWIKNPTVPAALSGRALLTSWSVTRGRFDATLMPIRPVITAIMRRTSFGGFQSDLEGVHGGVHNAVGGTMRTARSPADPLFWLHHAQVDRLWAQWQASPNGKPPSNRTETLKPKPLVDVKVSAVLDIARLGYGYE
jgi:tyrosinase